MRLLFFIASLCLFLSACKDPGSIGAGLLEGEEFLIDYTDTISVPGKVVRGDSIVIYSNNGFKSIGIMDGPIFGETTNQLFLNTTFNSTNTLLADPDFTDSVLDSVILRIPLSKDFHYGDTLAMHHVEVFQLTNSITDELDAIGIENLTTFTELPFDESNKIGDTTFVPNYVDPVLIKAHVNQDTLVFEPHLRVKLDNSFGQLFFDDQMTIETDTTFAKNAKGFLIRSTPTASSMMGLDMSNASIHSMAFYYTKTKDDGTLDSLVYPFNLGGFSHLNVLHEYDGEGSDVETALNNTTGDLEVLYVESYSGTKVEFDLSELKNLKDEIINYASFEITLADVPGYDTGLYPPVNNFYLLYDNEEGEPRVVPDIAALITGSQSNLERFFGGVPVIDGLTGETKYTMNISTYVRELLDGKYGDDYTLTLRSVSRFTEPNRSIIYGSGSDGPAPKLKLVITKP